MKVEYCIFCDNEAVGFYLNDHQERRHVCYSCMDAMEQGEWYGQKGIELSFDLLDNESDEQEVSNES